MATGSFHSDVTYCSLAEKSQTGKGKRMKHSHGLSTSQIVKKNLMELYHKIQKHFGGIELLEKTQIVYHLKELTKLRTKSYKMKTFIENLKGALMKIYRSIRSFEKSFVLERVTSVKDPLKSCNISEDLKIVKNREQEFILAKSFQKLVVSTESTFSSDILTNNNFDVEVSQNPSVSSNPENQCVNSISKETEILPQKYRSAIPDCDTDKKTISDIIDPTQDNNSFIRNYQENNLFKKPVLSKKGKNKNTNIHKRKQIKERCSPTSLELENNTSAFKDPRLEEIELNIKKIINGEKKIDTQTLKKISDEVNDICSNELHRCPYYLCHHQESLNNVTEKLEYFSKKKKEINEYLEIISNMLRVEKKRQKEEMWEAYHSQILFRHGYSQEDIENLDLNNLLHENMIKLEEFCQQIKQEPDTDYLIECSKNTSDLSDQEVGKFAQEFRRMCALTDPKNKE